MPRKPHFAAALFTAAFFAASASAQSAPCSQSFTDAWFTGPMLANTAATPPRHHALIEPYLFDVHTLSTYAPNGTRQPAPAADSYNSETYVIVGLTDRLALGVLPQFGYNTLPSQPSSAGPRVGDLTLILQRRLTALHPCHHLPTISLALEQTLPTGAFDNLTNRPTNALGQGAFTTTPALFTQLYLRLPNHHLLRSRLDLYDAISTTTTVHGVSVYNTAAGFTGTAHPGNSLTLNAAFEYSLTRRLALASDIAWRTSANTCIRGTNAYPINLPMNPTPSATTTNIPINPQPILTNSGTSTAWAIAPAIEYSWRPWLGLLIGTRLYPAGHNTQNTITPAIALSITR
ncbi:MAG: hypothetical protein WBY53_20250 [Acidobacteriaceae bacterium]